MYSTFAIDLFYKNKRGKARLSPLLKPPKRRGAKKAGAVGQSPPTARRRGSRPAGRRLRASRRARKKTQSLFKILKKKLQNLTKTSKLFQN